MKEYDIFVPLYFNDGTPIQLEKLQQLQHRLLDEFEGLTFFPQPSEGYWKMGGLMYRDEIVIYRVLAIDSIAARSYLVELKEDLKREFAQEEILIIERDVDTL